MASHTVLEPKLGERSIHTEEQPNMECRSRLRRAAWHSVLEHKQGETVNIGGSPVQGVRAQEKEGGTPTEVKPNMGV